MTEPASPISARGSYPERRGLPVKPRALSTSAQRCTGPSHRKGSWQHGHYLWCRPELAAASITLPLGERLWPSSPRVHAESIKQAAVLDRSSARSGIFTDTKQKAGLGPAFVFLTMTSLIRPRPLPRRRLAGDPPARHTPSARCRLRGSPFSGRAYNHRGALCSAGRGR